MVKLYRLACVCGYDGSYQQVQYIGAQRASQQCHCPANTMTTTRSFVIIIIIAARHSEILVATRMVMSGQVSSLSDKSSNHAASDGREGVGRHQPAAHK
jgi:hypothetical protein